MSSIDANAIAAILLARISRILAEKYAKEKNPSAIKNTYIRLENYLRTSNVRRELVGIVEKTDSNFRRNALDRGFGSGVINFVTALPAIENPQFQNLMTIMFSRLDTDVQIDDVGRNFSRVLEKEPDKDQLLEATTLYLRILRNELFRTDKVADILRSLIVSREGTISTQERSAEFGKLVSILSDRIDSPFSKSDEELSEDKLAGDSTTDAPPPDVSKKKRKGK